MSDNNVVRDALEKALAQTQDVYVAQLDLVPEMRCRVCESYVVGVYTKHYAQAGSYSHPKFTSEVEHAPDCWIFVARAALGGAP